MQRVILLSFVCWFSRLALAVLISYSVSSDLAMPAASWVFAQKTRGGVVEVAHRNKLDGVSSGVLVKSVSRKVRSAPSVVPGKQGKHISGHRNYDPRKSTWKNGDNGVFWVQLAWCLGKHNVVERGDGSGDWIIEYDFARSGHLKNGETLGAMEGQTAVRVHLDKKGCIHGYPTRPKLHRN